MTDSRQQARFIRELFSVMRAASVNIVSRFAKTRSYYRHWGSTLTRMRGADVQGPASSEKSRADISVGAANGYRKGVPGGGDALSLCPSDITHEAKERMAREDYAVVRGIPTYRSSTQNYPRAIGMPRRVNPAAQTRYLFPSALAASWQCDLAHRPQLLQPLS